MITKSAYHWWTKHRPHVSSERRGHRAVRTCESPSLKEDRITEPAGRVQRRYSPPLKMDPSVASWPSQPRGPWEHEHGPGVRYV